jgi:chemotaxis protein MotB
LANEKEQEQPIIIKKVKKGGHGHHGGAWKVAYADFVTAMMAFFLLLWLLSVATSEQKEALSNYFDPTHPKISSSQSGAGGILGGLSLSVDGAMTTNQQDVSQPQPSPQEKTSFERDSEESGEESADKNPGAENVDPQNIDVDAMTELERENLEEQLQEVEDERFQVAMEKIEQEIQETPELQTLSDHLMMDITPEGLRIQIVDKDGRSMFSIGKAEMYPFMRELLQKVAAVIKDLPNFISIRGHTDSTPYSPGAAYNNWDLSSDRAQSSRRALRSAGYPEDRIQTVVGKADRDHLIPEDPNSAQNRRISVILLRDRLTRPTTASIEELKEKISETGGLNFVPKAKNTDDSQPAIIQKQEQSSGSNATNGSQSSTSSKTSSENAQQNQQKQAPIIIEDAPPTQTRKRVLEFP